MHANNPPPLPQRQREIVRISSGAAAVDALLGGGAPQQLVAYV